MTDDERLGLENLSPPKGSKHSRRRVGRGPGSGVGKTSGRGHKGQKARSGGQIPIWFEGGQMPLYRRIPKRGFRPLDRVEYQVVNLRDLDRVEAAEIGVDELAEAGLVDPDGDPIKILGDGDVDRALEIRAHAASRSARDKIEAAGGTFELLE